MQFILLFGIQTFRVCMFKEAVMVEKCYVLLQEKKYTHKMVPFDYTPVLKSFLLIKLFACLHSCLKSYLKTFNQLRGVIKFQNTLYVCLIDQYKTDKLVIVPPGVWLNTVNICLFSQNWIQLVILRDQGTLWIIYTYWQMWCLLC